MSITKLQATATDKELTAGAKGASGNSTGADVKELANALIADAAASEDAVNELIDIANSQFDTVALMKASTTLVAGDFVKTLGYYTKGDGGGAEYKLVAGNSGDNLGNHDVGTLTAELNIKSPMNARAFGAKGDGTTDDTAQLNAALAAEGDAYADKGVYLVSDTLQLKRGKGFIGTSTFDDQNNAVIKRADGMNKAVIATEKYFGGATTHYYALKGITVDGNKDNQTIAHPAIAYWGVFVGSILDNVFVIDNFGAGLSLEHDYDLYIGLLWVNGCVVGTGASIEIEQTESAAGPIGLIDCESIYVENTYVTLGGGSPRTTPANRGAAIKAGNIGRLALAALHTEACDVSLHLTHGTVDTISISHQSSAWCGDPAKLNSQMHFEAPIATGYFGPCKTVNPSAGYSWLSLDATQKASNVLPEVISTNSRWGGIRTSSSSAQAFISANAKTTGDTETSAVNAASSITHKIRVKEESIDADAYYFTKAAGDFINHGAKKNQGSEKVFTRLESYGNAGDRLTDFVPRVLPVIDSTGINKAFYVTSSNQLRIRLDGIHYDITMTAV